MTLINQLYSLLQLALNCPGFIRVYVSLAREGFPDAVNESSIGVDELAALWKERFQVGDVCQDETRDGTDLWA